MASFRVLVLNDDKWSVAPVEEFLEANGDALSDAEQAKIRGLDPGDVYDGGGGATPEWFVIRIARVVP